MVGRNTDVEALLDWIPKRSVGIEIGVWRGDTSDLFIKHRDVALHLVDPWSTEPYKGNGEFQTFDAYLDRYSKCTGGRTEDKFEECYEEVYQSVVRRFKGRPVTVHRCTSAKFFETANGLKVDWVYIDGLHSYEGCLADLRGAAGLVKSRGSIFGDDYGMPTLVRLAGVTRAVDEFAKEKGLKVIRHGRHQFQIQV